MGMKKPLFLQCEKKYLATAMVLFEYCAAFAMLIREKIFRGVAMVFGCGGAVAQHRRFLLA